MRPGRTASARPGARASACLSPKGERLTDVTLRVWKYGVIAGTVVDEAGEPVVGIAVRALIKNVVAGRTQYGNMQVIPELVPAATTDDRGMFRLSQLVPGTYVVFVPSTQTTCRPRAWRRSGRHGCGATSSSRAYRRSRCSGSPARNRSATPR